MYFLLFTFAASAATAASAADILEGVLQATPETLLKLLTMRPVESFAML